MSLWYHPSVTPQAVLQVRWDELLADDARAEYSTA